MHDELYASSSHTQGYAVRSALVRSSDPMQGTEKRQHQVSGETASNWQACFRPTPVHTVRPNDSQASKAVLRTEELRANVSKWASNLLRI